MRMRVKIQLAAPAIGYVRVQLRGGEVGVAEHLLDRTEIGATLQQVRREGVAEEVGVDALRLEPGLAGQAAQDEEGAGAGGRAPARVQEQLLEGAPVGGGGAPAVGGVEVGAAPGEVAAKGLRSLPPDRDDALLAPLAERSD